MRRVSPDQSSACLASSRMSALRASAVLLCTVMVEISARVLTTTSPADQSMLSPRHYQHTDPDSGTQLVCDKCPAGTHVSVHCNRTTVRECSRCPDGTFTRGENGMQKCHPCRTPCAAGFVLKAACTSTQDRVCTCPPNSFLSGDGSAECKPHSLCPPGTRVKRRGSETEDVLCKPCTKGTFSAVESSAPKCPTYTDCQAQGLVLLTPGTKEIDNICGDPSAAPSSSVSTTTPLGPAQAVLVQEPMASSSTPSSSLTAPARKGTYSQSAAIQLRGNSGGEDRHAEGLLLSRPGTPTPPDRDPPWISQLSTHKQLMDLEQPRGQPNSDPVPGPNQVAVEGLVGVEVVRVGVSKVAGQGSGGGGGSGVSSYYRPTRRGSPRPSTQDHFDINEHLPWMIVLLLLLVLVVIVICSVKRSSRVLKKGPMQDPSSIIEKAIQKKATAPRAQVKEKWIYYSNGQGVDILKLVAAQVGSQWIDVYQSLANATEREVAAFSNGYSSDHERAYAALQHWTIRDADANLAKLINALHRQRRIDVVEKIRCVMEDNPQDDAYSMATGRGAGQSRGVRGRGAGQSGVSEVEGRDKAAVSEVTAAVSEVEGRDKAVVSEVEGRDKAVVSEVGGRDKAVVSEVEGQDKAVVSEVEGRDKAVVSEVEGQDKAVVSENLEYWSNKGSGCVGVRLSVVRYSL
ncbi:tumor necrosis factor receptor superfamily member 21 [Clinocottus analis]|uniref:tumor necrosis factor receptor superfamily member 21 n=1 Tax=Clinocottus analis TaxID=304258 RepID=UPI0035C07C35